MKISPKATFTSFIVLVFVSSGIILFNQKKQSNPKDELVTTKQLPYDQMYMQRVYPNAIKPNAYRKAIQWKKANQSLKNTNSVVWEFVGPNNIGGRISDIEIASNNNNTIYVGAASGGIFKSTDNGNNWSPIFDDQNMLSIGDIDVSKTDNNVIYVGTGEPNAGGGSLAYDGDGIYKSIDGGITWTSKGLPDIGSVGKVLIDPDDDQTVYVGAMGPLFRLDANRGVYKTTNGGNTWSNILFLNDNVGVIDMAIHPMQTDTIYAVTWQRERTPEQRNYGGVDSGIHRSVDGGTTWTELNNGLPATTEIKGRISIDISQSNPNILYALYTTASGSISGVYKTEDSGNTWAAVNHNQLTNVGFHWWFGGLTIDPTNPNVLYNVGFNIEKSIDGGNNWLEVFLGVHVDQHALAFKTNTDNFLLGNDGGLFVTSDGGTTYSQNLKLPITQFYRFHVDAQDANRIYGGSQDNGTIRTTTGGANDWSRIFGGDGFQPLVNPTNSSLIFSMSQFGNLGKSTNDAASYVSGLNGIPPANTPENFRNWDTPVIIDPNNNTTMYYGASRLYKSVDAADNWTVISPDLTNNPPFLGLFYGTITSIDVSPINSDYIYVGTDEGNVWITQDGGVNWTQISSMLPNRWVTKVLASPIDINSVYVTFSGYRYGEDNGHVYKSSDNGTTWTNLSIGLPDIPVNDLVMDTFDNLFLGTDIGVIASDDDGLSWNSIGVNLPAVVVTDLHIHEASGFLYAATYGRSSYKLDIGTNILNINNAVFGESIKIYPNPTANFITITSNKMTVNSAKIYNQLGQLIMEREINTSSKRLDVSHLSKGMYHLILENGNKKKAFKIIKK